MRNMEMMEKVDEGEKGDDEEEWEGGMGKE